MTNKELLLKHVTEQTSSGSRLQELMQVLPILSKNQVQTLLRELKKANLVRRQGATRGALWFSTSIASK